MSKEPVFHWTQSLLAEAGKEPFSDGSDLSGKLGYLLSQLDWKISEFCRMHQIVYKEIHQIKNAETDGNRVVNFADHMAIAGLWAIGEQFLGKIFKAYLSCKNGVDEITIKAPCKWDDVKREYLNNGIDLSLCKNYVNANECRILNNAIRHESTVSNKLVQFAYFVTYYGMDLEKVPLEMQRYVNSIYDFLESLIRKANENLG